MRKILLTYARHPTERDLHESVEALKSAYADLEAGQTCRPARDVLQETCRELGLAIDE